MKRRTAIFGAFTTVAIAVVEPPVAYLAIKMLDEGLPTSATTPDAPPAQAFIYDEASDMVNYSSRGSAGLKNACAQNLFSTVEDACRFANEIFARSTIKISPLDLMVVGSIESLMVPTAANHTTSALGTLQTVIPVFIDQIVKHIIHQPSETRASVMSSLIRNGESPAHAMVHSLIKAGCTVPGLTTQSMVHGHATSPVAPKEITARISENADVLNGRIDPYASLMLGTLDLLLYCNANPEIATAFGDAKFRAINQLGPTRALMMAQKLYDAPQTPLSQMFGMQSNAPGDPRAYIAKQNNISVDMSLAEFIDIYKKQEGFTRAVVTAGYDYYAERAQIMAATRPVQQPIAASLETTTPFAGREMYTRHNRPKTRADKAKSPDRHKGGRTNHSRLHHPHI